MTDVTSRPGRHRALTDDEVRQRRAEARSGVPVDVRDALGRLVTATEGAFDEDVWEFTRSLCGWVAHRREERTGTVQAVGISADCRAAWVPDGEDPEETLVRLERDTPMSRSQVEFLLAEHSRFHRGTWRFAPVSGLGWVCTRSTRLRGDQHFVVTYTQRVLRVDQPDPDKIRAAVSPVF